MITDTVAFMHGMRANRLAQGLTQKQLAARVRMHGYDVSDRALATSERGFKGWHIADSAEFRTAVAKALGVSGVILSRTPVPTPCQYCHMRTRTNGPCDACYSEVRPRS